MGKLLSTLIIFPDPSIALLLCQFSDPGHVGQEFSSHDNVRLTTATSKIK